MNCSEVLSPFILTINCKDSKTRILLKLRIYIAKPYPNANPIANDQVIYYYWEGNNTLPW